MPRPQFSLSSLFVLTGAVAAGCLIAVTAMKARMSPFNAIVATGVAMLLFASELSRFFKSWNDPRIYDEWPKTGVFPKPEDEDPGETSVPPKRASPPDRAPKD